MKTYNRENLDKDMTKGTLNKAHPSTFYRKPLWTMEMKDTEPPEW